MKGWLFDFGGTIDTNGCHWGKLLWQTYCNADAGVTEEQFRQAYVYGERTLAAQPLVTPSTTLHDLLETKLGLEMSWLKTNGAWQGDEVTEKKLLKSMLDMVYAVVEKNADASRNVLERLSERFPLVLVTNFYGNMPTVLRELKLSHLFTSVVESAVVGVRKPDPNIFRLGVERLGLSPGETVVVGDSYEKDIVPANKIGCRTVWLKGQAWDERQRDESLPDAVITTLSDVEAATAAW